MIPLHQFLSFLTQKPFRRGFTLIEILVVIITLGALISLALPNYNKIVEQSYCRNAQMNLLTIYNASLIRESKNTTPVPFTNGLPAINPILKINLTDDPKFDYVYRYDDHMSWMATATRKNGPNYTCMLIIPGGFRISCTSPTYCPDVIQP